MSSTVEQRVGEKFYMQRGVGAIAFTAIAFTAITALSIAAIDGDTPHQSW